MTHRGRRSQVARKRRRQKRLEKVTTFDRKTGEVLNIQERYIHFEIVPESLGFLSVGSDQFNRIGIMFLFEGEVLINKHGDGTIQTRPEVFA